MKKLPLLCLFVFALISCSDEIKITVHVDKTITSESQWVYLYSTIGYQFLIDDSCFVHQGTETFSLYFSPNESGRMAYILFSKNSTLLPIALALMPGDQPKVYINSITDNYPLVKDSPASEEYRNYVLSYLHNENRAEYLLSLNKDSMSFIEKEMLSDSIAYYIQLNRRNLTLHTLEKIEYAVNAYTLLLFLDDFMPYGSERDRLISMLRKKFPDYMPIQIFPTKPDYKVESEESRKNIQRIENVLSKKNEQNPI